MKRNIFCSILVCTMLLSACSTSLDVVGDYKETLVVYGLLDVSQDTQYVKINKAFLGAGDAYQYALIKDSTQFVNALDVTIKCVNTGITYNLTPANYIPKDPGLFYSPTQTNVIYKLVTDGSVGHPKLNATSIYELSATNGETGTRVTSKTSIVEDITGFIPPYPPAGAFTFASSSALAVVKFRVDWVSAKNARQYQLSLRLNYVDSTVSGGNVSKSLDYLTPIIATDNLAGGKTLSVEFKGKDYYKYIASSIPAYSGLINRKVSNVQVFLVAGSDDFATFIDVNKPSTGIIQERPEFTNIVGGLGLFSSRCDRTPLTRSIGNISLDSLACGQFTKTLKFVNSVGSVTATGDPICL